MHSSPADQMRFTMVRHSWLRELTADGYLTAPR